MRDTLGDHLFEHFVAAKREEWLDYIKHVSPWESRTATSACTDRDPQ